MSTQAILDQVSAQEMLDQVSVQPILDQVNHPRGAGGAVNIAPVNNVSQTFIPTLPCLVAVEIGLQTGNPGRGGDQVTLTILGARRQRLAFITASIPEGFDGFWRFTLPGRGISVTPGQPLTLLVQDTGKIVFWWKYMHGNPYPAGQAYFYNAPFHDNDFYFQTYGLNIAGPTQVPEVIGLKEATAATILREAGFVPKIKRGPAIPHKIYWFVYQQSPAGYAVAAKGSTVTILTSQHDPK